MSNRTLIQNLRAAAVGFDRQRGPVAADNARIANQAADVIEAYDARFVMFECAKVPDHLRFADEDPAMTKKEQGALHLIREWVRLRRQIIAGETQEMAEIAKKLMDIFPERRP